MIAGLCSYRRSGSGAGPAQRADRGKFRVLTCRQASFFRIIFSISASNRTRGGLATSACCAAVRGTTTRTTRARPTASTTIQTTVTTTTGFGWCAGPHLIPFSFRRVAPFLRVPGRSAFTGCVLDREPGGGPTMGGSLPVDACRLRLAGRGAGRVELAQVGPLLWPVFDRATSISTHAVAGL